MMVVPHLEHGDVMQALAINRTIGTVFLNDGSIVKMQNFVDRFGDDTDDVEEAIKAIAPLPDGKWLVIDLTQFENVVRN